MTELIILSDKEYAKFRSLIENGVAVVVKKSVLKEVKIAEDEARELAREYDCGGDADVDSQHDWMRNLFFEVI